ncbi:vanadium-dependent haloperoxidase [Maricaulis sp.]|uniref:vanadium-dependent haloperoxidase n=1 Tax=Maricaulis sp. TaxID=1486257 RepID=UPI003A8D8F71
MLESVLIAAAFAVTNLMQVPAPANAEPVNQCRAFEHDDGWQPSAAYHWVDVLLDISARDVVSFGARPTVLSRQMAIVQTAVFDAWAAYDATAVGTRYGANLRRPVSERTDANKQTAIAFAAYRSLIDQYPAQAEYAREQFIAAGYDPDNQSRDPATPEGIGNLAAAAVLQARHHDGANQLGDEAGSDGEPYSQYIMYRPVNHPDVIVDADRWQPIPASDGEGGVRVQTWLTPHWYRVAPFGLDSADQFRAPPPPLVGSQQLLDEANEVAEMNANLTDQQKALVEFMRDGPASTAQSGHWLQMAQVVSCRDRNDLDTDIRMYFAVANVAMDAFIASWDSKIYYDTSRPWTLIRHYHGDRVIEAWGGPGLGTTEIPASEWHPYSPRTFPTPPFGGYPSGHSTISGAAADTLARFTGDDHFGYSVRVEAGSATEPGFEHPPVTLEFPTFSGTADAAGISRLYGGYHIMADNLEGLAMGRRVSAHDWSIIQSYFDGTAIVPNPLGEPEAR